MTQIKLCGLTRLSDIEIANKLRPEYVGFVFWEKSRRHVSRDKAGELKKALMPGIKAVGVFVDEDISVPADLVKEGIIDVVQLHGSEDGGYVRQLRALLQEGEIIKALKVKDRENFIKDLKEFEGDAAPDYFLFDSGTGSGQTFNWELIKEAGVGEGKGPGRVKGWFLAGGLDPCNVVRAIESTRPTAVDVSSGIETDGVKDPAKMEMFVKTVRSLI